MTEDFYVKEIYGVNFDSTLRTFLITNQETSSRHFDLTLESILCFEESNANAICDLLNKANNPEFEFESTKEIKEVMNCLKLNAGNLNHDIVKTIVEEVYHTRREIDNVE